MPNKKLTSEELDELIEKSQLIENIRLASEEIESLIEQSQENNIFHFLMPEARAEIFKYCTSNLKKLKDNKEKQKFIKVQKKLKIEELYDLIKKNKKKYEFFLLTAREKTEVYEECLKRCKELREQLKNDSLSQEKHKKLTEELNKYKGLAGNIKGKK